MSSHLLKMFTRLSKWLVRGPDKSTGQPWIFKRSPYIQTERLPPYMDRLYRSLLEEKGQSDAFRPERLRLYGLYDFSVMARQHDYVKALNDLPRHHAKDTVMSAGPLHTNPNLAPLPERDRKIAEVSLAKMLFAHGMNKETYEFFASYMHACSPDESYTHDEDNKIKTISDSILSNASYIALINSMQFRKRQTCDTMAGQYNLRLTFMQAVADEISAVYKHPSIPVILDEFPSLLIRTGAYAIHAGSVRGLPSTGIILVNALPSTLNDVAKMIDLVGHEMRHMLDSKLSDQAQSGRLLVNDANFVHAGMITLNAAAYIGAPLRNGQDKKTLTNQFNRYAAQYMERAARNFGEKLEKSLSPNLPDIVDPSFEIQKIYALSMH